MTSLPTRDRGYILAGSIACALFYVLASSRASIASDLELFDLPYGPEIQQKLDVCRPNSSERSPAVVMIHGGGWSGGRKEDFRPLCKLFASRGIVAVAVNYRLADGTAEGSWPAQLKDVLLAADWLRAQSEVLGVDANKLCVFGSSAGAQIALMLSKPTATVPDTKSKFRPSCVLDNWGPVDLRYPPPLYAALQKLLPDRDNEQLNEGVSALSPLGLIDQDFPPVFVTQGMEDSLVPRVQSERLVEKLKAARVDVQFVEFLGGHEMSGLDNRERQAIVDMWIAFILRYSTQRHAN